MANAKTTDTIKDSASQAASVAADKASQIADQISDKAHDMTQSATETAERIAERGSEIAGTAEDQLRQVASEAAAFVRRNPGVAIAGAVGLGLLLGLAAKRNS